jgi:hypothetical protein
MDAEPGESIQCWFIGGPRNNELIALPLSLVYSRQPLMLPYEEDFVPSVLEQTNAIHLMHGAMRTAEYYPQFPLPTGVPVYSSLFGSFAFASLFWFPSRQFRVHWPQCDWPM